ncbi:MAG: class I SAM-dependent methyltransferase [Firmicutes bacterium]|nr:class I SAM-dependent methyltransferase [Bacillota bacterium]
MKNNSFENKGTFRPWSAESIQWYERASAYTRYHQDLSRHLLPHLRVEDRCCELACGTGSLARMLAPHVAAYTANDIDAEAIAYNEKILRESGGDALRSLTIVPGDWKTALEGQQFDTVLFSFFGAVLKDWDLLRRLASRRIIAITYGGRKKQADDRKSRQEHAEDIAGFLEEKRIPFETIFTELEFGQPLADMEDARRYTRYYYQLDEREIDAFLAEKLIRRSDGTLYFPKKKSLGIIIIRMDEKKA